MEFVLLIVGAAIGVGIGWYVWQHLGAQKLNDDFAKRLRHTNDLITNERMRAETAEQELQPLRTQVKSARDERKDIQKQLDKLKGRFDKLKAEKSELDAAMASVHTRAGEADRLTEEVDQAKRQAAAVRAEAEDLRTQVSSVDDLRTRLVSAQDRLVEAERAKEDARLRAAEAEEVTRRATVELEASMDIISTLRSGAESALTLQRQLDAAESTTSGLEMTVAQQTSEIADLRSHLAASTIVTDDRQTEAIEPEDIDVSETPSEQLISQSVGAVDEEGAVTTEPPATQTPPSDRSTGPEPQVDRQAAVDRMAEVADRTRGGHEVANDNLKKIHGVGPKLEKLLKSLGITSYLQVANFTSADIETVTLALDSFPGRIERDDWVGSADQLHRDKYESDDAD